MLSFFKKFRSSMRFMDRVSEEIGVEKKVFQTALTEMGVNFSIYEQYFTQQEQEHSESIRLQRLCMLLIPQARLGAARLHVKFGDVPQIERLVFKMIDYQEAHIHVVDDPAGYRRNAMYQ